MKLTEMMELMHPDSEEVLQTIKDGTDPDHFANSNQVEAVLSERGIFHNHH